MKIVTYSSVKYVIDGKYHLISDSNFVITVIVNPLLKVCKSQQRLIVTNNTGVDLKEIYVIDNKNVITLKLKNKESITVSIKSKQILITYKILINNIVNTIYLCLR